MIVIVYIATAVQAADLAVLIPEVQERRVLPAGPTVTGEAFQLAVERGARPRMRITTEATGIDCAETMGRGAPTFGERARVTPAPTIEKAPRMF